jgi:hyaluronan synthase
MAFIGQISSSYKERRISAWIIFFLLVYAVLAAKLATISGGLSENAWLDIYSVGVGLYILSRFALAYFYEPEIAMFDPEYVPTVSFGVPSKNEEENIRKTIMRIAQSDYPKDRFDVIAVNDGSDDRTLQEMQAAREEAAKLGITVKITDWKVNRGKRAGMAECVRQSSSEIMIFIDSDSFVEPSTAKELVKYFIDPKIAAVAGHSYVANAETNMLTKMQSVRYFVSFKAYKAAEALFGSVTCCSGCCSAYCRSYMLEVLEEWENQRFLGVACTYGDDRSLTNYLLRNDYLTVFAPEARAYTVVPDTYRKFMKQQLRWKKSWVRESLKASVFMWKRNPLMSISFYLGVILSLVSPVIVMRALIWYPVSTGRTPLPYLFGLALMATLYGFYYYVYMRDSKWIYGAFFATFYTLVLIWQLPVAILNLRDARWGTR